MCLKCVINFALAVMKNFDILRNNLTDVNIINHQQQIC